MNILYRRSYLFGLVIILVLFVVGLGTVNARWLRLGNTTHVAQIESICKDGLTISVAYAVDNPAFVVGTNTWRPLIIVITGTAPINMTYTELLDREYVIYDHVDLNEQDTFLTDLPLPAPPDPIGNASSSTPVYNTATLQIFDLQAALQATELSVYLIIEPIPFSPAVSGVRIGDPVRIGDCTSTTASGSNQPAIFTSDNRLNRAQRDLGATAAIFCEDNSVKVYGINAESQGFFAFSMNQDEIDALGQPTENTLLDSFPSPFGGDIRLYLLTTGELQLNAPGLPPESWKEYVFTWAGCKA